MKTIPLIEVRDPEQDGAPWTVLITPPGGASLVRSMDAYRDPTGRVWPMPDPSTRPAAGDTTSWDRSADEFLALVAAVADRAPSLAAAGQAEQAEMAQHYGRHLFDALIGHDGWKVLTTDSAAGARAVGLRWGTVALHHLVWELMHDGQEYLALDDASPMVLLRLGPAAAATTETTPSVVGRLPRVLFAVGAKLSDPSVRSGAEVMGVLRAVERGGGAVSPRVMAPTSLAALEVECARFGPDIVHVIGHGRWDAEEASGKITFQAESGNGTQEHTGSELADAIGKPTLAVVSACESGAASSESDAALPESGGPLAAALVENGVPIVIAMAGAISDTACRVFTRAVAAAVALGVPFVRALSQGRQAAFTHTATKPNRTDWALPAVYARAPIDDEYRLVDPGPINAMRVWIERHEHSDQPLFAGRQELLTHLDDLLVPDKLPGVLMLHSSYRNRVGGTRALRELSAEAMRLGHLPVRIGPFVAGDAPTSFEALIAAIAERMRLIAKLEGVEPPVRCRDLGVAAAQGAPPVRHDDQVDALRADLDELRDRVAAKLADGLLDKTRAPVLLLDDVHLYDKGLDELFAQLGPQGLGVATTKLPVVLFGKETPETPSQYGQLRGRNTGPGRLRPHELFHVVDLKDEGYAAVFLCWMLHPTDVEGWPQRVLAPCRHGEAAQEWIDNFRDLLRGKPYYDPEAHALIEARGLKYGHFVEGDDVRIMKSLEML